MNLRFISSLLKAFFTRFKFAIIIGILSGFVLVIGINFFAKYITPQESVRIGLVGKYRPDTLPEEITSLASLGLTQIDKGGSAKPGLASSWETNDSGKTWIFHLDSQKKWQDGKYVQSQDIKYSFSDVSVEKPDAKTIVFKLKSPFAPFPTVVSKPVFKKGLLGNSEWKIYKVTLSGANIEKLFLIHKDLGKRIYKFYPTEEQAKLGFKLGEVDKLENIFNPEPFGKWTTLNVSKESDYQKYAAIFLNTEKGKLLSEKTLRQALAYATNKDFKEPRALSPISPNSWAYNAQVKPYNFDPERAKQLIKDLPADTKKKLSITISTIPLLLNQAEEIQKNWQEVGIKTEVRVTGNIPGDFDVFLGIFDTPKDPDQYALWHSNQENNNFSNYSNPRIDKLLEDGRTQTNTEERKKIYLDFQRFLVEDSPAIFLYHPSVYTIERK